MLPDYAELHCLSSFSFLRGASHARELLERAAALGYAALAITDECSFAGIVRAHVAARAVGLKLIVGTEVTLACGMKLVLLAMNRAGYGNLAAVVTLGRRQAAKGSYRLSRGDLAQGIPDCLALWVPEKLGAGDTATLAADAHWLAGRFPGRCWIACERLLDDDDDARLARFATLGLPLVAAGDVHMHIRSRRPLQDALTALRLGTTLDRAGHALFANGERHLRSRLALSRRYPPTLLAETLKVAARCEFSLDELRYEYPEEIVPQGMTPAAHLRAETEAGLLRRYPDGVTDRVRAQVEHELRLIAAMQYEAYFLTVHDIVGFARRAGILCQGRGSAANSAVCFALGITEVDPARAAMLFERFISKERNEPPDIDVDFEHQRREEVIQYIYAKYGRSRAALAAAVITYRTRGALRDAGRALGMDLAAIDGLTSSMSWWDKREDWPERFAAAGLDPASPRVKKWLWLAGELKGFPRHLTQHVGGFVIARGRLDRLVPIENAAMAGRSVIQWDKDDIDALGLMKVDVLALGMLSAIRRALDCISQREGRRVAIADIPAEDPATYAMIRRADTVGVFQIESRAQMAMLPRLKPRTFYDLVIEVAIVRPGPIQGDMVHPYLRRRQGLEPVTYPSAAVRGVLERTLGVPIFQEQAMQIAIVAAGFSPGEADQLRRAMAAWKRSSIPPAPLPVEGGDGCSPPGAAPVATLPPSWGGPAAEGGLAPFRDRLLAGMRARGYADAFAAGLYRQIEGFGEYGFPESHAASFALLVYVSAWLKCHEPAAFLVGLLNSQPMGFYSASQLVQDARRHGVEVLAVDVMASGWESVLEGAAVRLGLHRVKGLGQGAGERIAATRCHSPFRDLADLAHRARLDRGDLDALAAAGALAQLSGNRRAAAWQAAAVPLQRDLFLGVPTSETVPQFAPPREGEEIVADYAHLGLSLGRHPLSLLRPRLTAMRYVDAATLRRSEHRRPLRLAGLVTCRQRPGTAGGVIFLTLEDETGLANVIVHGRLAERSREPLLGSRLLGVLGVLQREGEVVHLIAKRLVDHSELLGQLEVANRDFC
ncbi:MAG: error-prone DNA polymerase [Gammaproteobacteria bacterium]|nr:error-prone DNA polymerase [Gammaproteobacteria bacterium]MBU1646266.1 error-prone DNA polymerase [Gammaproteobacteria bacterium]MBU1971192.1 error-prone DNA polymerase [Gammaproteobacteria bacterium]